MNKMKTKLMQNKRGDVAILLLVVLVLLVTMTTIFTLVTSSEKVEIKISNTRFIENFYLKQDLAEFYIGQAGEKAIVKTYKEFVEGDDYINNPIRSEGEVEFGEIHSKLNENFRDKFRENFKTEFSYDFENNYLKNLRGIIIDDDFEVIVDSGILTIVIDSLEMNIFIKDINITYVPEIFLDFDFKKIGLHSFEEIYEIKEKCKEDENIEDCYNNLINFEVSVVEKEKSDEEKYIFATLATKKDFLIGEKFENIEFSFVPR